MESKKFKEIEFNNAKDFLSFLTPWTSEINIKNYIFRGHSNDNYQLIPTAMRVGGSKPDIYDIARKGFSIKNKLQSSAIKISEAGKILTSHQIDTEYKVLRTFYKHANSHGLYIPKSKILSQYLERDNVSGLSMIRLHKLDRWMSKEIAEVATIAQHYGLPTRLLDWSYSPHVAAFFASCKLKKTHPEDSYISVWMLNIEKLSEILDSNKSIVKFYNPHYQWNENALSQRGLFTYIESDIGVEYRAKSNKLLRNLINHPEILNDPEYEDVFFDRKKGLEEIISEEVEKYNEIKDSNNKIEKKDIENLVIKIKIPSKFSEQINRLLREMNICEPTIFPGYSGVVDEILYKSEQFKNNLKPSNSFFYIR